MAVGKDSCPALYIFLIQHKTVQRLTSFTDRISRGFFFLIYGREAIYITFDSKEDEKFTTRPFIRGINAVSRRGLTSNHTKSHQKHRNPKAKAVRRYISPARCRETVYGYETRHSLGKEQNIRNLIRCQPHSCSSKNGKRRGNY